MAWKSHEHFSNLAGWPDALAILSKKPGDGIPLDVYACGAVIRACEQNGQWGAALEALHYALEISLKVGMFNGWVGGWKLGRKWLVRISKQTKKMGGMVGFSGWKGLVWWSLELFCWKMMIGCCVCQGTLMKCKGSVLCEGRDGCDSSRCQKYLILSSHRCKRAWIDFSYRRTWDSDLLKLHGRPTSSCATLPSDSRRRFSRIPRRL